MRGRKPKPTHLKLVTGNAGKRKINEREPKPPTSVPPVPAHLSDEAKVEWGRVSALLEQMNLISHIDRAALAAYCQAYADWAYAESEIRKYGHIVKSPTKTVTRKARDGSEITETSGGYPMQSPFVVIRNKSLELMHKYMVEFGMTPSSRTRIVGDGTQKPAQPSSQASKYF